MLPPRNRADVFSYLDDDRQVRLVEAMPPKDAAELLHLMSHDERADLVNRLDEDVVDPVLPFLAQAEREDIRRLASYEPGTAGAVDDDRLRHAAAAHHRPRSPGAHPPRGPRPRDDLLLLRRRSQAPADRVRLAQEADPVAPVGGDRRHHAARRHLRPGRRRPGERSPARSTSTT